MATRKPNILVIWGDDIGQFNVSAYNHGMMGYKTPNIDRIAKEGALFTDWYGQQSCTAGRAAFITGQSPIRTGLTKVGLPGANEGMTRAKTRPSPSLLKTARLHDRPVRQEPPRRPRRHAAHRPRLRRVLRQPLPPERRGGAGESGLSETRIPASRRSSAARRDPQLRPTGKQSTDTGPLTSKRMETIDEEVTARRSTSWTRRQEGRQAVLHVVEHHPHAHLHAPEARSGEGKTGLGVYADGMVEHDGHVGQTARRAEEAGHRRQHHRHVFHRQRRGDLHVARRRHDAVPRREEHAMGGRLPRSLRSSAGPASSSPARSSTTSARTKT